MDTGIVQSKCFVLTFYPSKCFVHIVPLSLSLSNSLLLLLLLSLLLKLSIPSILPLSIDFGSLENSPTQCADIYCHPRTVVCCLNIRVRSIIGYERNQLFVSNAVLTVRRTPTRCRITMAPHSHHRQAKKSDVCLVVSTHTHNTLYLHSIYTTHRRLRHVGTTTGAFKISVAKRSPFPKRRMQRRRRRRMVVVVVRLRVDPLRIVS